jgi:hypothetical protein
VAASHKAHNLEQERLLTSHEKLAGSTVKMKILHLICLTLLLFVSRAAGEEEEKVWWDRDASRKLDAMTPRKYRSI